MLVVIDGAKALYKAPKDVFGKRCWPAGAREVPIRGRSTLASLGAAD